MATVQLELQQNVWSIFERLHRSLQGIVAIGLSDANGLPVAFFGPTAEREASTAMATLLLSAAQRATQALGLPGVRDVVIDADGFNVLVHPVGKRFTLVVIAGHTSDIGRVKLLAGTCGDDIRIALES
jgi:predicted regulator of Ras-like GTPase activity (Roadblock/LC7/MglB family)